MPSLRVCISGCHAGPNPSPGLGIARSLRLAFPHAYLIAKDHSLNASGVHDPIFDDVWICRPWNELDLGTHRRQIQERLDNNLWYLSGLDLEVRWLAETRTPRTLLPPAEALRGTVKPTFPAAEALPVRIPDWVSFVEGSRTVHQFCRAHDWRVWVKGSAYEARRAETWSEVRAAARQLRETWGPTEIHVQEEIRGWEVSIVYVAWKGALLDAVFMEKRLLTEAGKTWAGTISRLPGSWMAALRDLVADLNWTGGAELEFIRDPDGSLWLMDWNPRFPAWIHAVTLAGGNLPALLVGAASGVAPIKAPFISNEFTRVVAEIPVRKGLSLPPAPPVKMDRIKGGKHPSGMPLMSRRLEESHGHTTTPKQHPEALPARLERDVRDALREAAPTPARLLMRDTAKERFARFRSVAEQWSQAGFPAQIAYSCKTNPSREFLALARECGFWIEVISPQELEWARGNGFGGDAIVYNGPVPCAGGLDTEGVGVRAAFADSLEAFEGYVESGKIGVAGVRLRPPFVESRFGVAVESFEEFSRLVDVLERTPKEKPLGASIHIQSSQVGVQRWKALVEAVIGNAVALEEVTGRRFEYLDLGGGHAPDDADFLLTEVLPHLIEECFDRLPALERVILEPGKALVEPCAALVATILEIRSRGEGFREAVIDAGIAEVPLLDAYPHRIVAASGEQLDPLLPGRDCILGRSCMENDIVMPRASLPDWLREGDRIVICDCGAYDASMAYPFGKGSLIESDATVAR